MENVPWKVLENVHIFWKVLENNLIRVTNYWENWLNSGIFMKVVIIKYSFSSNPGRFFFYLIIGSEKGMRPALHCRVIHFQERKANNT